MTRREIAMVTAAEPSRAGLVLTLKYGDGHVEEYRTLETCPADELLAHVLEVERPPVATNRIRARTLTGDWFEASRNYPRG